ncbi:protein kinase [Histoplasma capsulatum G186AR]|uniref:Protein kinase n=1 Tax=Ajellomyces capsulatus (strain G186AR / H82 / ATCC MYA-2454 / RMSCC 2432) TaxID=447093 RepID=C0NIM1_AJECG|nr:protein kinase [Histoplasma capsulatum G186AR]EEH08741.1 protein kinase [Histoplasma capsulatum G186AR]
MYRGIGTSLHSNRRFTARDGDGDLYDAANLAQLVDDAHARELACVLLLSQYPGQWKPSMLNWRIRRLFFGFFEGL